MWYFLWRLYTILWYCTLTYLLHAGLRAARIGQVCFQAECCCIRFSFFFNYTVIDFLCQVECKTLTQSICNEQSRFEWCSSQLTCNELCFLDATSSLHPALVSTIKKLQTGYISGTRCSLLVHFLLITSSSWKLSASWCLLWHFELILQTSMKKNKNIR